MRPAPATLACERVAVELLAPAGEFVERPLSVQSPFSGAPRRTCDSIGSRSSASRSTAARSPAWTPPPTRCAPPGGRLPYDRLVVAAGARAVHGVSGAVTFRGPVSAGAVEAAVRGARSRVLLTLPAGTGWPPPALRARAADRARAPRRPDVAVVTPERRPRDVFGAAAADPLARLLDHAGVEFTGGTRAAEVLGSVLVTDSGALLEADAVVSLPRLLGPRIDGLPADPDGFLAVDRHGRVPGVDDVFAAGDVTAGAIKERGLATQQADAVAEWIAAEAGAPITPLPAGRVLRGVVLTGEAPLSGVISTTSARRRGCCAATRARPVVAGGQVAGCYRTGFLAGGGEPGDRLADRPPRTPAGVHGGPRRIAADGPAAASP